MPKKYKKGVYTTEEIALIAMRLFPGRFKHLESAKRRVNYARAKLGITDINGKQHYMQFTIDDMERIISHIENGEPCRNGKTRRKAYYKLRSKAEQISLFDDDGVSWIEPDDIKAVPPPVCTSQEKADAIETFWRAWVRLCEIYEGEKNS